LRKAEAAWNPCRYESAVMTARKQVMKLAALILAALILAA
jgi:hypothetical protein